MKSNAQNAFTTIGEVAERFGIATHVLRHWESVGLLTPVRDRNGPRQYVADDLVRVAVILRAKDAGLGLDAIRDVLVAQDAQSRRAHLELHREALRRRIADAQASLDLIDSALTCDHDDFVTCPHFQQSITERIGADVHRHAG